MIYDKKNDFYDVLGVKAEQADAKKIKLAYYKMAQKYHPDKAGDDKKAIEKFKQVSNAYEVLVDENERKKYDRLKKEASMTSGYSNKQA